MAAFSLPSRVRPADAADAVVPSLIVLAWLAIAAAQASGTAARLHHHALIEDGPPVWLAIPVFLGAWLVMVAAMMLPASLPTIRLVEAATGVPGRARRLVRFLMGFGLVWIGFGLAAYLGDTLLHRIVDATPWLAARPYLIEAAVLAAAGAYQLTPIKRRALDACRHPASVAAVVVDGQDDRGAGVVHGVACLASSWALMLLMFAEGTTSLWWMAALTVLMTYEAVGRHGQRVAVGAGIVLLVLAVNVVAGAGGPG